MLNAAQERAPHQPIALGTVPVAMPDELLYSLIARTISHNAIAPPRYGMELFFGSRNAIPSIDLPTNLMAVQQRLGKFSPYQSVEQLIDVATLYPYFRPFLSVERHERCMAILRDGGGQALKVLMGIVANGFGAAHALRYCASCQRESFDAYGTLFWQRSQNLPGVVCCLVHGIGLSEYPLLLAASHRQKMLLPPLQHQANATGASLGKHTLTFARLSADLMAANLAPICPQLRSVVYQAAIRNLGLGRRNGKPEYTLLADAVRAYYNDFGEFRHASRLLSTTKTPLRWIQDCIERPQRALHPICHLTLIGFLFEGIEDFVAAIKSEATAIQNKASIPRNVNSRDVIVTSRNSTNFFDPAISCRTVAAELGLSVTTVVNLRRNHKIPISERRKHIQPALVEKITQDLLTGKGIIRIAKKYSVSIGSIYRILQQQPETKVSREQSQIGTEKLVRREKWMKSLGTNHGKGIKAARAAAPNVYAWLYRHDRQWLNEQNRKCYRVKAKHIPRIDWARRDALLVSSAIQFVDTMKETKSRPRISKTLILRYLGCSDLVRAYPEKLPRIVALLPTLAETVFEHQKYRIEQAVATLILLGTSPAMWQILRKAGIKVVSKEIEDYIKECLDVSEADARTIYFYARKAG